MEQLKMFYILFLCLLHKPSIRKFNKRKVPSPFIYNIWGADPAICHWQVNLIKDLDFYYVLLMFTVNIDGLILWKIKKITITNAFQKILGESNCKPNKIWAEKAVNFTIDNEFVFAEQWYKNILKT